jgi:hypothetical protein
MEIYRLDENMREGRSAVVATYNEPIPMTFRYFGDGASRGFAVFENPQKKLATIRHGQTGSWSSDNVAFQVK